MLFATCSQMKAGFDLDSIPYHPRIVENTFDLLVAVRRAGLVARKMGVDDGQLGCNRSGSEA